jgi:hypothetical protein
MDDRRCTTGDRHAKRRRYDWNAHSPYTPTLPHTHTHLLTYPHTNALTNFLPPWNEVCSLSVQ